MQCREPAIEGRKSAAVEPRQFGEVAVGHLAVADDSLQLKCGEGDGVWPELMPFAVGQGDEDRLRVLGALPPSDENAEKAALGNGTGGELDPNDGASAAVPMT